MGTLLILFTLLNPPIMQVSTAAESRPPALEPTFTNLMPDLAARPRPGERYAPRSEPVLGYVQRRLCVADAQAQALWADVAAEHPNLWQRLPLCPKACAWARTSGQADACACSGRGDGIFFGCGNDPRNHDACLGLISTVQTCVPEARAERQRAIATLKTCAETRSNRYQRADVVEQLVRLQGWPAVSSLFEHAIRPAQIAFTALLAEADDGLSFERMMRESGHLAPDAPRLEAKSHPSFTLLAFWMQYGQAVKQHVCGTMDFGPACEPDTTDRLVRTTFGALEDVVFHHVRGDVRGARFEAWAPDRVWRIDAPNPAEWTAARLALVNAVLAHRKSWGRLHQAWLWVYYASAAGLADADRRGLSGGINQPPTSQGAW